MAIGGLANGLVKTFGRLPQIGEGFFLVYVSRVDCYNDLFLDSNKMDR